MEDVMEDKERADIAEEAHFQAEEEVAQLKAMVTLLEGRLAESEAKNAQLWSDFKLLLGEAGVSKVRSLLIVQPDREVEAALRRYVNRLWIPIARTG